MNYIDLHTHVLWGIDDGAQTLDGALELIRLLSGLGFTNVCATPHQKVGSWVPSAELIGARHREVAAALKDSRIPVVLSVAAENYWDELFLQRAQTGAQPGYTDGPPGPAEVFLFELPVMQLPPRLEEQLFSFRLRGKLPVMAHPERYIPLWQKRDRLAALARCAALVVDVAALDGAHGPEQQRAARSLVQEGLCHAVTSDIHQPDDIRGVAAGIQWIKKKLGPARLKDLLVEGPRQILAGELPELP